jgi:hypothetical protein
MPAVLSGLMVNAQSTTSPSKFNGGLAGLADCAGCVVAGACVAGACVAGACVAGACADAVEAVITKSAQAKKIPDGRRIVEPPKGLRAVI